MTDIYGTGGPITVGSQVVVQGHGMGTVKTVGCPVFGATAGPAFHVVIEGDRDDICFPARLVKLYADVYAGITPSWEDEHLEAAYEERTDIEEAQ